MENDRLLSVKEFARLSRTTRYILHHYDKIGLLSPAARGENNYRYYARGQLALVNVIRTLQNIGMTLAEIRLAKENRTPAGLDAALANRAERIDSEIHAWVSAKNLLNLLRDTMRSGIGAEEDSVTIQFMPAEAIILGPVNEYGGRRGPYDALADFYHHFRSNFPQMNQNYPAWALLKRESVLRGNWGKPDQFYFFNPAGYDKRPAALYAVGHARCGYGGGGALYERMLKFIGENGFEVCGNAYEEYPLNELSISDPDNYLLRVLITVRKKDEFHSSVATL